MIHHPAAARLARVRELVARLETARGYEPTVWIPTTDAGPADALIQRAVDSACDLVIAAGGDGTVRAVGAALASRRLPFGIVPLGTGNLLARNLELPLTNLEQAVEIAFTGDDRQVDLGMVEIVRADGDSEEHAFLVMAGLGLDAKMIKNTNTKLKKAVGWLAYIDGITRSLPELRPVRIRYRLNGAPERAMSVHTIIVGNCGMLPGGLLLMPEAKPDDGILDIAALRPRGPFGWAKVWRKVAWENGVLRKSALGRKIIDLSADVRDVTYLTGTDLKMTVEGDPEEFQLDGDEFGEARSVHAWVDPGALTVKVPAAV